MSRYTCTIKNQPPGATLPFVVEIKHKGKRTIERHFKTEAEAALEKHAWETGKRTEEHRSGRLK